MQLKEHEKRFIVTITMQNNIILKLNLYLRKKGLKFAYVNKNDTIHFIIYLK